MLDAIHHVALICTDYDRSRRFYVELLGLDLIREVYREERQSWKADLRIGFAQLELFSFPAQCRGRLIQRRQGCGTWHLPW